MNNNIKIRENIIEALKEYFDVRELVCPHTFSRFGVSSWQVLRTEQLANLLAIRKDILKCPMYLNNWHKGGNYDERGNRCNACSIVLGKHGNPYLSAHTYGAAFDFQCKDYTAHQARTLISENADKLPYPLRLEKDVSWIHFDCNDYAYHRDGIWVYLFK